MSPHSTKLAFATGVAALALLATGLADVVPLGSALGTSALAAVVAIVSGGIAIRKTRTARSGRGLAIAGLVLGIVAIVASLAFVVALVAAMAQLGHGD